MTSRDTEALRDKDPRLDDRSIDLYRLDHMEDPMLLHLTPIGTSFPPEKETIRLVNEFFSDSVPADEREHAVKVGPNGKFALIILKSFHLSDRFLEDRATQELLETKLGFHLVISRFKHTIPNNKTRLSPSVVLSNVPVDPKILEPIKTLLSLFDPLTTIQVRNTGRNRCRVTAEFHYQYLSPLRAYQFFRSYKLDDYETLHMSSPGY